MPEPGYNDGDQPPFWLWVCVAVGALLLIIAFNSCG